MPDVSAYERLQIGSVLDDRPRPIQRGKCLFLASERDELGIVYRTGVLPALRANDLVVAEPYVAFDSDSALSEVCDHLHSAEVIIADLSDASAHLMYVLGLAHALGRCPLLMAGDGGKPPFNLQALRMIQYGQGPAGLTELRDQLERAIRVFLMSARASDRTGSEPPKITRPDEGIERSVG
jgi:hypothetical protein